MHMKKVFAVALCAVMLLCLTACNKEPVHPTAPSPHTPEAAGVLFVSVGAEFKVIYDTDGLVVAIDSLNDTGADIVIGYGEVAGAPCDAVVSQLVKQSIAAGKHPATRVVVIKQAPSSKVPSAAFLEDVRIDTAAVTDFEVVLISADTLTGDGYISAETAKDILLRQLKLTGLEIACSEVAEDMYTLTFEIDGAEQEYKLDAVTGTVILESLPSDLMGDLGIDNEPDSDISFEEEESFGDTDGPIDPQ